MPPISNGFLAMMLLIGTETILFTTFIGAYLILRAAAISWPPPGTPMLRVGLSAVNTVLLIASSIAAFYARRTMKRQQIASAKKYLGATLFLGVLFLVLQGIEFHRLYHRGLTLQTGPYGAVFFTLVTCHGLHVLGGLVFVGVVWAQLARGPQWRERVGFCEMYWHFVTAVWLVLFSILYIL